MGKHKGWCSKCTKRHFPPTGKKCQEILNELSSADEMPVKSKKKKVTEVRDSQLSKNSILSPMSQHGPSSAIQKQDCKVNRASTPGLADQSGSEDDSDSTDGGPFLVDPIPHCHKSPLMTREKPHSDHRRVIVDLSWPKGFSVNSGVDKDSYLGTEFVLSLPTIDDITACVRSWLTPL